MQWKYKLYLKVMLMISVFLLTGCADIGFTGVSIDPEDTWLTILIPINILIALYLIKKEIDFWYFKKEEKYKERNK